MKDERIKEQRTDGKRGHAGGVVTGWRDGATFCAGERTGSDSCAGQAHAYGQPLLGERCADAIEKSPFAAEEMRGARHIQQQCFRQIESDERRVAVAPGGDAFEEFQIGCFIRRGHVDVRYDGARIRQRHAGNEPQLFGGRIGRADAQRILLLRRHNERFLKRPSGP